MRYHFNELFRAGITIALATAASALAASALATSARASNDKLLFIATGAPARMPIGWAGFCTEHAEECDVAPLEARDVVLTSKVWKDLARVNEWVNEHVTPLTDLEHWGVVERWSYPDDGYGDCEDYVLLKRRMLMQSGWPRQALLITVVRDSKGEGHAVLTVKTDKGEFILDNQQREILLWSQTSYHFVKRQSQTDPNLWISLGDPRPAPSTTSR